MEDSIFIGTFADPIEGMAVLPPEPRILNRDLMRSIVKEWLQDPKSHITNPTPENIQRLTHELKMLLDHYERTAHVN